MCKTESQGGPLPPPTKALAGHGRSACMPTHSPTASVGYREIQYSHGLHKDTEPEEEQAGWVALSPRNRGATCWHKRLTHAETDNPDCMNTGLMGASPRGA